MTSRFKYGLALVVALAAGCVLVLLLGTGDDAGRRRGSDLVADDVGGEGDVSEGPSLPTQGTMPEGDGKGGTLRGPDGGGSLVGVRLPEGIDLSDPAVRDTELRKLMAGYPIDWQSVAKIVALMTESVPAELKPIILNELKSGSRNQVMFVFAELRDASFIDDLFGLLDDPAVVKGARGAVLTALWQMPGGDRDDIARRLEGRLTSDVRNDQGLLQAIAKRGGAEAARALVEYLQRVPKPREIPPHVLQSLDVRDPAAGAIVAAALRNESSDQILRQLVLMSMQPGAKLIVEPLRELDRDGVADEVRAQVLTALGRIGDPVGVAYLIEKSAEPGVFGQHALRGIALVDSADAQVAAQLAKALSEADRNPRPAEAKKSLLLAIGAARDIKSLPAVAAILQDPDEEVRNAAVQAMERMGQRARPYVERLAALFEDGGPRTQLRVVIALGSIGGEEAVVAMRALNEKKGLSPSLKNTLTMALRTAERALEQEPR